MNSPNAKRLRGHSKIAEFVTEGTRCRMHEERAAIHLKLVLLGQHDHVALPKVAGDLHSCKYAPPPDSLV